MFNVTILTHHDNKKMAKKVQGSDTLHMIGLDHSENQFFKPGGGVDFSALIVHENNLINKIFRVDDSEYIRRIRAASGKYDGAFMEALPYEVLISKRLFDLPTLKWGIYLPDPILSIVNWQPWTDYSMTLPSVFPLPKWILYDLGH